MPPGSGEWSGISDDFCLDTRTPFTWPWPDQLGGGHEKYTHTIGDVLLLDGTNVNHALVKDGWCWWYRKYAPGDTVLEGLGKEAREAKKRLWADPQPVPPWVYRKAKRGQTLDLSDLVPLKSELEGSGTSRGPPRLGALQSESSPDSTSSPYPIIGNR